VEQAHQGAVWSLALLPDKSGFVSGSADKTVKVWTWTVTAVPVEAPSVIAAAGEGVTGDKPKGKKAKRAAAEAAAAAAAAPPVTKKVLGVTCTRQLEMAEDVLCVRVSPDGRLLAVALLDSTIKVRQQQPW
jgi:U3 small nucleolar RNA-associated protein 12